MCVNARTTSLHFTFTPRTRYLTTAYTCGGFLSTYVGGQLGKDGDYTVGARLAAYGSLAALALVYLLPDTLSRGSSSSSSSSSSGSSSAGSQNTAAAAAAERTTGGGDANSETRSALDVTFTIWSMTWLFLFVKVVTSVANSMARSVQPLVLKDMGFNEEMMGNLMSVQFAFGGAAGLVQGKLTELMGGDVSKVVRNCIVCMGIGYAFQSFL